MFLGDLNLMVGFPMPSWHLDHKVGNKTFVFHFHKAQ